MFGVFCKMDAKITEFPSDSVTKKIPKLNYSGFGLIFSCLIVRLRQNQRNYSDGNLSPYRLKYRYPIGFLASEVLRAFASVSPRAATVLRLRHKVSKFVELS